MAELAACRLADLAEAKPTVVVAGERELVLVRWRGDVYALRNVCPHMSTSFERGAVTTDTDERELIAEPADDAGFAVSAEEDTAAEGEEVEAAGHLPEAHC